MSDRLKLETTQNEQWRELRDERGKLYGRLDPVDYLLEIRRNQETVTFDLRDYIEKLSIAMNDELC
jgi:hypothetical protein